MTKNRGRSIDTHFHDRAGSVLLSLLPIKAARNSFMTDYNLSEVWFHSTDDQKSFTIRWRSFSQCGREGIAYCFADKGGQKFLYDWLQRIGCVISLETWPKIVDAALTFILTMVQGGYCYLFCQSRQRKIPLWLRITYRRCDFPGHMNKTLRSSIDNHFPDVAGRVLLTVLPTKAPRNSFVTDYNLSELWFPRTHDQKS